MSHPSLAGYWTLGIMPQVPPKGKFQISHSLRNQNQIHLADALIPIVFPNPCLYITCQACYNPGHDVNRTDV